MNIDEVIQLLREDISFRKIFALMCRHDSNVAAEYLDQWHIKQITYAQYEKMAQAAAYQIEQLVGEQYQDGFIGLKLDNCPQWPVVFWGILMAGYKPVLLDFRLSEQTTSDLLTESGAVAIIHSRNEPLSSGLMKIAAEELWERDINVPADWQPAWADEMALCTSGTTGSARVFAYNGYAMSHSILNQYEAIRENRKAMPDSEARLLAFVPFHHVYGFVVTYLTSSTVGKTIVYLKNRAPSTILQACQIHRVTHIYGIPLLWNNLASAILKEVKQSSRTKQFLFAAMCDLSLTWQRRFPNSADRLTSRLFGALHKKLLGKDIILLGSGGGPILPGSLKLLNAIGYNLICGYGLTETGITSIEVRNDIDLKLTASVGRALGLCEYRVVPAVGIDDPDTGELYIRSASMHTAQIAKGAYLPPVIDEDGWLATGDIATFKNNTLWLKGRLKEVIINESGENIYPDELETLFSDITQTYELCILGVSSSGPYEDITLVLYSSMAKGELLNQIIQEVSSINNTLPLFKRLNQVLLSAIPLPMTNNMKVRRIQLKEGLERNEWPYKTLDINHPEENAAAWDDDLFKTGDSSTGELAPLKQAIRYCFAEVLRMPPDMIHDDSHFIDDLGGDSLSSLELLVKLEDKYAISISDDEYFKCNNINELSLMIYSMLNGADLDGEI